MKVYLMRHGIAVDAGPGFAGDAERPLSEEGCRKTAEIAKGLCALGVAPHRLLASPLRRARQTAEIIARSLDLTEEVEICAAFAPGGNPLDQVRDLRGTQDILAVGHMPDLSDTAARLLTGEARGAFDFRKGSVACLAFEGPARPGRGAMEWMLTPRQLRTLARLERT